MPYAMEAEVQEPLLGALTLPSYGEQGLGDAAPSPVTPSAASLRPEFSPPRPPPPAAILLLCKPCLQANERQFKRILIAYSTLLFTVLPALVYLVIGAASLVKQTTRAFYGDSLIVVGYLMVIMFVVCRLGYQLVLQCCPRGGEVGAVVAGDSTPPATDDAMLDGIRRSLQLLLQLCFLGVFTVSVAMSPLFTLSSCALCLCVTCAVYAGLAPAPVDVSSFHWLSHWLAQLSLGFAGGLLLPTLVEAWGGAFALLPSFPSSLSTLGSFLSQASLCLIIALFVYLLTWFAALALHLATQTCAFVTSPFSALTGHPAVLVASNTLVWCAPSCGVVSVCASARLGRVLLCGFMGFTSTLTDLSCASLREYVCTCGCVCVCVC